MSMPGGFDPHRRYTDEEYFAFCDLTQEKLEMYDGYIRVRDWDPIRMMAGGSANHAVIIARLLRAADRLAVLKGCDVFTGDIRIQPTETIEYCYPDAVITCGPEWSSLDQGTLANPLVIFEVLSPSTETNDRTIKFNLYAKIPSVQAVVFVASRTRGVEIRRRRSPTVWLMETITEPGAQIEIEGLGVIALDDLYRDLATPLE